MWVLLAGLMVPPTLVTVVGNRLGGIPHQATWVILLGCPLVLVLLALPRRYLIDAEQLIICGLVYRVRIPVTSIRAVKSIGALRALVQPGSIFCSDPSRALLVVREGKFSLVISPKDPNPFLRLDRSADSGG